MLLIKLPAGGGTTQARERRLARASTLAASRPEEPSARLSYIRAGKSWTNPREEISKAGRRGGARDQLGLHSTLPGLHGGRDTPSVPARRGLSLSDTRWPGWPSDSWFPPLPRGEREGSQPAGPPSLEGRPSAVRCPGRGSVSGFHTNPMGGVWRSPLPLDCSQGRGKPAQELLGSRVLEFGQPA